ncbi:MAG: effector-associated domain EAD1-containing protein [Acidimicrobiaceae bacterium]|nr:effector-associated domain EAD1-containing protein [Acidimicrobiaceae bacterium]
MTSDRLDALIVTALQLEHRAVREHLDSLRTRSIGATVVDIGRFATDTTTISVGIIECGPGNIDAATLTTKTAINLRSKIVLMVGVAGGVKDVRMGDVVASSKIYWAESGRSEGDHVVSRPDVGPVSTRLVQVARMIATDGSWLSRRRCDAVDVLTPKAIVAPIVVGERVIASSQSADANRIRSTFSDAVAVAMEDVGVTKAAATVGADGLAIRAISDLLDNKTAADASGSQTIAASNAAAFAFELLAKLSHVSPVGGDHTLHNLVTKLYPQGPTDRSIWERAGGDPSRLQVTGDGHSIWWSALQDLNRGGGGANITLSRLIEAMLDDYPDNPDLSNLIHSAGHSD